MTGEELYTRAEFRRCFELRAADIVNPDVCNCGGIQELRAIAQMAEPSLVTVSPHNYNSTTVGLAATVHVSAAIPNFLITEYFVNFEARGREIAAPAFEVRDGYHRGARRGPASASSWTRRRCGAFRRASLVAVDAAPGRGGPMSALDSTVDVSRRLRVAPARAPPCCPSAARPRRGGRSRLRLRAGRGARHPRRARSPRSS